MRCLIVYQSRHGTTCKVAKALAKLLRIHWTVDIHEVSNCPNLERYDCIVIGGSIHAGHMSKGVAGLLVAHHDILLRKRLGLFVCGMHITKAQEELRVAFPQSLRDHSSVCAFLGGEFIFEKMRWYERVVVRIVAGARSSISRIDYAGIDAFAKALVDS